MFEMDEGATEYFRARTAGGIPRARSRRMAWMSDSWKRDFGFELPRFFDLCFDIKGGLLGYVLPRFVVAGEAYGFWVNVVDGG